VFIRKGFSPESPRNLITGGDDRSRLPAFSLGNSGSDQCLKSWDRKFVNVGMLVGDTPWRNRAEEEKSKCGALLQVQRFWVAGVECFAESRKTGKVTVFARVFLDTVRA